MKKAFEAILQSGIDVFELVQKQVRLSSKDVEALCELNPGTLALRGDDSVIKLRYFGENQAN
ncbi:hypothetical protein V8V88_17315 [Paenibacillus phytohabitans]